MKKGFKFYVIFWATLLALFNVISFVSLGWKGYEKYSDSFWLGYILISAMFVGQFICTCISFGAKNVNKLFYNISLVKTSYAGLIWIFIIGGLLMLISTFPLWIGVLLCSAFLAFNIIAILKAKAASDIASAIDDKVRTQTFFIKSLTVDAEMLMLQAKSENVKAECKKLYETVRYSDPMSNDALSSVESQITLKFSELSNVIKANDEEKIVEMVKEATILVVERNRKCQLLK